MEADEAAVSAEKATKKAVYMASRPPVPSTIPSKEEEAALVPPASESRHVNKNAVDTKEDFVAPRKRTVGPEMPSAELLAAAAKLAEAELREAELDGDSKLFIGPLPPAMFTQKQLDSQEEAALVPSASESRHVNKNVVDTKKDFLGPRKRTVGPEMPSVELLAAAAKLTAAEAELREAELDGDSKLFIGPPPPAMVKEAESSNEAERFEEITRIIGAEEASPYDVMGMNKNMSAENMKKRYWKLSLMVHPDKSSHPQANRAFVKLNKAFKDLQDPDKRKALDDKIKLKEEQESFQAELKAMREAAQWRRLQGICMDGDDILLAESDVKVAPKREEWMQTLPPERKPGVSMHSTKFSKSSKEGRGDTSVWTDTPSERAQKAKMNYLEAYNEAAALASNEQEPKKMSSEAKLVDQYNKANRSQSLVEKHQEASTKSRVKKRSKQESVKQEWEGSHPWKPWDREKDLTAGRQSVDLDRENMTQSLSSRFSSGSFQRNFL